MSSQRRQFTSQTTARRWESKIRRFLLTCFFLQLILVGAGLYYTGNLSFLFPKKNVVLQDAPIEENDPVEEKNDVISAMNKTTAQSQESVTLEDSTDKQQGFAAEPVESYPEKNLPPELASSSLQVDHTDGDTEDGDITSKNTDIAEMSSSESLEQTIQDSTVIDFGRRQQIIPVIYQDDGSTTAVITREISGQNYYTVQIGDNLGSISNRVYGTFTKWSVIANANTDQLGNNPNRLYPGMTLVIPALTETGDILLQPDSSAFLRKTE